MVQLFKKSEENVADSPERQTGPARTLGQEERTEPGGETPLPAGADKDRMTEPISVASEGSSTWVLEAEKRLREGQEAWQAEQLRQELLNRITGMNNDEIVKIKGRLDGFKA